VRPGIGWAEPELRSKRPGGGAVVPVVETEGRSATALKPVREVTLPENGRGERLWASRPIRTALCNKALRSLLEPIFQTVDLPSVELMATAPGPQRPNQGRISKAQLFHSAATRVTGGSE